jgi:hypothetical protein
MNSSVFNGPRLNAHRLRPLTIDPADHPDGRPHLSAASGLVCFGGNAYVIADDEHHLAVFAEVEQSGALHSIVSGNLPATKAERKKHKPDFETLFSMTVPGGLPCLVAMGSGSRRNRNLAVVIALNGNGEPSSPARHLDLSPMFEPLVAVLGAINIEGALIARDAFVLLNRGVTGKTANAVARFRLADFFALMAGRVSAMKPISIEEFPLPAIDGVALGFTDGTPLPDGRWVFTAVAENTKSSYADGPCIGSAVGLVAADGDLLSLHRLSPNDKVEGIDARVGPHGIELCMVTDTDDPEESSWLIQARL